MAARTPPIAEGDGTLGRSDGGRPDRSAAVMTHDTTLVGRRRELEGLRRRLERGPSRRLVVRGPAGIGKTRLVVEAVRATPARWVRVRAERPLVPLSGGDRETGADLAAISSQLRDELTAGAAPTVLVIDDAHLLDAGASAVVADLAGDDRIRVVMTVRDGEPLPDHVEQLVAGGHQIVLDPLPDDAIEALVGSVVETPVALTVSGRIRRLAEGNPLYARELVLDALHRGQLIERADGTLDLTGDLDTPSALSDLVARRVAALECDAAELLRQLVLAEPLPTGLTARLAPAATYDALERTGLISTRDGAVVPAHPLIAEAVAAGLSRTDRAELAPVLLERVGRDHPDGALRAATWALDADVVDGELLLEGARTASARLEHDLARRLAERAVDAGAGSEAELLFALSLAADPAGAAAAEERLAALEPHLTDDAQRSRAAFARARNLLFGLGRPDLALVAAERSLTTLDATPWRVEVRAVAALAAMLIGEVDRAVAAGEGLAGGVEDPRSRATVEVVVTLARTLAGRLTGTRERIALAERLLREVPERDHLPLAGEQLALTTAYLELYTGDLEAGAAHTDVQLQRVLAEGSPLVGTWLTMAAHVALLRGDLAEVVRLGTEAVAALEAVDLLRTLPLARCQLAAAEALLGRPTAAEAQLTHLRASEPHPPDRTAVNLGRAEAAIAAASGDLPTAVDRAMAAGAVGRDSQHRLWAVFAYHDAVRYGGGEAAARGLEVVANRIDGGLAALLLADAQARVSGDPARMASAGDDLLRIGARAWAAECYLAAADATRRAGGPDAGGYEARAEVAFGDGPRPPFVITSTPRTGGGRAPR